MDKNILLQNETLELYEHLTNEQTKFYTQNKEHKNIIPTNIIHPKMLGSTFLTTKQIQELRKKYDNDTVSTALTQLDLQKTAYIKHGEQTQNLLFIRTSLEQSTRYPIAKLHAMRFENKKLEKIADLGCGIGIDSYAIAEVISQNQTNTTCEIKSYELEPQISEITKHNLSAFPICTVINDNIENIKFDEEKFDALYADPARRKNGKRIHDPNQWSPSLDTIYSWLKHCPNIGAKLAPGIEYKYLHPKSETNWVSVNGELVESSIWFGALKQHTGKTATILKIDNQNNIIFSKTLNFDSDSSQSATQIETTTIPLQKGLYITEVDPAILRANGLAWVSEKLDAKLISENISYLISKQQCSNNELLSLIQQWEIIDYCTLKPKKINEMLQNHSIGSVEIKKRGTDISPENLRKTLKLKGKTQGTIILSRYDNKHVCLLVQKTNI